jgi:hypothetical protein
MFPINNKPGMKLFYTLVVLFAISVPACLYGQNKNSYAAGITLGYDNLQSNLGLNIGKFYKNQYSEVDINYGTLLRNKYLIRVPVEHEYFGLGFTHRYYITPLQKWYSFFFQGDISYSRNHDSALIWDWPNGYGWNIKRNIFGAHLGYGLSLNILHHIILLNSVSYGVNYIHANDIIYGEPPGRLIKTRDFFPAWQIRFGVLYRFKRF